MNIWLILLSVFLVVLYVIVRVAKPSHTALSRFEVERLAKAGDAQAKLLRSRLRAAPLVLAVRSFISLILVLGVNGTLSGVTGGFGAAIITIVLVLAIAWLERWKPVQQRGETLYLRVEPRINKLVVARKYFFFLPVEKLSAEATITSEAELLHVLDSVPFLEPERRTLIHSALEFTGLNVSDAMSSRRAIKSVDKGELLGPLVLDELYKTGKQAFVVTDGGLDTVVGILKLERLTNLDMQESPPALKAMSPEVHFIDAESPITDALSFLRSSKAPFLVVQDGELKTVGLLTMDNILRCLFEQ